MDKQPLQSNKAERQIRQYERMREREQRQRERRAASASLWNRFKAWAETGEGSQRTFERMKRDVVHLCKEIETKPKKYPQIDEAALDGYFTQVKERAISETLPRRRVTYLQMMAALRELVTLNTQWLQEQPRSKAEQAHMLGIVRLLLREVEAGHLEDIAGRFSAAIAQPAHKEQPE